MTQQTSGLGDPIRDNRAGVCPLTWINLHEFTAAQRREHAHQQGQSTPSTEPDFHEYQAGGPVGYDLRTLLSPDELARALAMQSPWAQAAAEAAEDGNKADLDLRKDPNWRRRHPYSDPDSPRPQSGIRNGSSGGLHRTPWSRIGDGVVERTVPEGCDGKGCCGESGADEGHTRAGDGGGREGDAGKADAASRGREEDWRSAKGQAVCQAPAPTPPHDCDQIEATSDGDPFATPLHPAFQSIFNSGLEIPRSQQQHHQRVPQSLTSPTFPPSFPAYRLTQSRDELAAYLANARYVASVCGPPVADLEYGIIVVPAGEERLLFSTMPSPRLE